VPYGPPDLWLPVNRQYRPLGMAGRHHVDHGLFLDKAWQFRTEPTQFCGSRPCRGDPVLRRRPLHKITIDILVPQASQGPIEN
jgi:hypothetical protein